VNAKIAVLALQGDFERHIVRLRELGAAAFAARLPAEIDGADGIILPGGESTTIGKLLTRYGIDHALKRANSSGKPIYGTCAGMILLAKEITEDTQEHGGQPVLGFMDITVARNAYGRQIDSFETALHDSHLPGSDSDCDDLEAVFIRAPVVVRHGDQVQVLARHEGKPVLIQEQNLLASSFHPELTGDKRIHAYFLSLI
jgi:pyridoxal 5'-phosphate synthase pdxT subunit